MAGQYPSQWLEELRARADIVQVISAYVPLKKRGKNYWCCCPFHGEKTPSFSVDPERQLYYCFGCKAGGSVFNFLMETEHLSFGEAVRLLADQLHVPVPELQADPDWQRRKTERDRLYELNREAARFFYQTLYSPRGEAAMRYLRGRGLDDATIRRFGLGAAPAESAALLNYLTGKGFTTEEAVRAGAAVMREPLTDESGRVIRPRRCTDMFRGRAIFPIIDQYGHVLGFGGRILEGDDGPKYLNTGDTPIFNKRKNVYAANLLSKERQLDRVILVEGYMDVISLMQYGVRGVCATLGTALTEEQAQYLSRFAPQVYLAYDGDGAGQKAILRGIEVFAPLTTRLRVLDFPDGLDPDEFIRRDGAEGFARLPAILPEAFRLRLEKKRHDLTTAEGRTEYARRAAEIIRPLQPIDRENLLQTLITETGFSREVLASQIGVSAAAAPEARTPAAGFVRPRRPNPGDADAPQEEVLLIAILATGRIDPGIAAAEDFTDPLLRGLYEGLRAGQSVGALCEAQTDEVTRSRAAAALMTPPAEDKDELIEMAEQCLRKIRLRKLDRQIAEARERSAAAQGEERARAMADFMALTRARRALSEGPAAMHPAN